MPYSVDCCAISPISLHAVLSNVTSPHPPAYGLYIILYKCKVLGNKKPLPPALAGIDRIFKGWWTDANRSPRARGDRPCKVSGNKKPALRRAGFKTVPLLSTTERKVLVQWWLLLSQGGFRRAFPYQFLVKLGGGRLSPPLLWLFHLNPDVFGRDSIVNQLLLELNSVSIPFIPTKEDWITFYPLNYKPIWFLLASFTLAFCFCTHGILLHRAG